MEIDRKRRKRIIKLTVVCASVLLLGIAYYISYRFLKVSVPCVFRRLTGFYCPGCGLTRMFAAIFEGDIVAAFGYNRLCFILLPLAVIMIIRASLRYIRCGKVLDGNKADIIILLSAAALLVVFGILRNLPAFEFLAPSR